jgi:hypothetical protein
MLSRLIIQLSIAIQSRPRPHIRQHLGVGRLLEAGRRLLLHLSHLLLTPRRVKSLHLHALLAANLMSL